MTDLIEELTNSIEFLRIDLPHSDSESSENRIENLNNSDDSNQLQNLNSYSNNLDNNMAAGFKPEYLNCVPSFDGNPNDLNRFLGVCESIVINFYDRENPNSFHNVYLLQSIVSKLTGNARTVANIQNSQTWDELKGVLRRNFADQRDETCLNRDLVVMRQLPNEKVQDFYDKILNVLNLLCSYVDLHGETQASKILKKNLYYDLALKTFLCGLREPLGTTIRCMRPGSLTEALQFVVEEENTRYFQNVTTKNFQKPNNFQNRFNQQNPNRNSNNFNRNFNNHNNSNNSAPNQNMPPQRYPTNSQVFRQPVSGNVFKSNPNRSFPKPTPMSINSRFTGRPNYQQNNNNPRNNSNNNNFSQANSSGYRPQQNYTAQELFNTETNQIDPCENTESEILTENEYFYNDQNAVNFHVPASQEEIT